jgi:hypothetical protein
MKRPGGGCSTTWFRRSRWAWPLLGLPLLLAGWVAPADAGQAASPTLTLGRLWNQGGSPGSWTPYTITVRNGGPGAFSGTAALVPDSGFSKGPLAPFPVYQAVVGVPAGGQRTVTVYAIEPASGYHAELRDLQGQLLTSASAASAGGGGAAVGVVSDAPQAGQRIDALLRSQSHLNAAVSSLAGGPAFPVNVLRLAGLNAIVLDQADSGALDQDQRRALLDFVALGGTLIEAGGASGRRTVSSLPAELLPLRPAGTATASLAALGELGGVATSATAQVTTGDVAGWAGVTVAAADGTPLVAEGRYGAGEIVELTFDPLAAPFDGQIDLAATAWSQALSRGLSGVLGSGSSQLTRFAFGAGVPGGGQLLGSGPGAASGFQAYLGQVVADAPAVAAPPFGLLAALLVLYVLVVSGVAYAVLKAVGRRGLLWTAVPAAAVACTVGAYAVGFGTRGSDYQLAQVQVQRLAPGGVVETTAFDGVLAPRRGDVSLTAPAGALVTTATPFLGTFQPSGSDQAQITVANPVRVTFANVAVWDMRPVETLTVTHAAGADAGAPMPIEARVGLRGGRLVGQVVNHTARAVGDLQLVSPSGARAALAPSLDPGATATVDVPLAQGAPGLPLGKGVVGPPIVVAPGVVGSGSGPVPPQNGAQALVALASSEVAVRPGEWALVGRVPPSETLLVAGQRPARAGQAMVVEPARLQFADSASTGVGPARLVSGYAAARGGAVDVFEQELPQGLSRKVALGTSVAPGPSQPSVVAVEVYDWDSHGWRPLGSGTAAILMAGETRGGVARARVTSDAAGQVGLVLSDVS